MIDSPTMILLLAAVGFAAGGFGALAGVGGGIIITPLLAIYFGVPLHQAIGVSLVSVIATSTATSSVHVEKHVTNIRLGMILELATTTGAATAAIIAGYMNKRALAMLFVVFLLYSASSLVKRAWGSRKEALQTDIPSYEVKNYPIGLAASLGAGAFSGLLGVGGGVIKVPVMYMFMGVPLRVATATSNFTIGVTAATGAYIYYGRGDVNVGIAGAVVAGVFAGSLLGARLAPKVRAIYVLSLFIAITLVLAGQMIYKLMTGGLA
ncbi:MAG TPA: sulfite exporter TauE/SafE family protein [Terriglobales bacterium]|nr:sulfite exporter TauE/SafE family protein [Terriglobales bacterium]